MPAHIISTGNYTPRKGYHVLIAALALVMQQQPALRGRLSLRLVGNKAYNPEYVAQLRAQIAAAGLGEQVILDDWLTQAALSQTTKTPATTCVAGAGKVAGASGLEPELS